MRTWIIGSGGDCDIVVAQPRVSRRHCRFTELADGHLVEDLGSSNGTYVNGERIAEATRVSAGDTITLGALVPMPWPPSSGAPGATVLRIGRKSENDIVLDDARVSSYHARLIVSEAGTLIEDAGSSNGTFVNSPDHRVTQAIPLARADTVYFGSLAVPAARLLAARSAPGAAAPPPPPLPQGPPAPIAVPPPPVMTAAPLPTPTARITPWTMLLLAQAPAIAVLILLVFGRRAAAPVTATSWPAVAEGIASTMFALALSAVWLGGSLAAWASLAGRSSSGREDSLEAGMLASPARRFAALGVLLVAQCAVLLAIVHWGSGLRGPCLSMFGVLVLASAVGLSLGFLVFSLVRTPVAAVVVLAVVFVGMMAMGGRFRWVTASSPGGSIAAAMPSRWAFEGLLLLENERRAPPDAPEETPPDLAEDFFPAQSQRMGPKADAMALGFMLIGLAGASAFLSANRE